MSYDGIPDSTLAQIPAMQPPSGTTSNFINPPSRNAAIIALNSVFLALMVPVVSIRLYVKAHILRKMWWDDYTCAIAAIASVAHSAILLSNLRLGYGRHLWDISALTLIQLSNVRRLTSPSVIYPIVIYFVKISILLLYVLLFGIRRSIRIAVYAGVVFFTLFYAGYLGVQVAYLMKCTDIASLERAPCSSLYPVTVFQGAFNVASDIYVFILPISQIVQLQVSKSQKIGLLLVFLAGFVACVVSIVRLVITAATLNRADKYWYAALSSELTIVEINLSIFAACMPTMPSFLIHVKILGSQFSQSLRTRLFYSRTRETTREERASNKMDGYKGDYSTPYRLSYIPLKEGPNLGAGSDRSLDQIPVKNNDPGNTT